MKRFISKIVDIFLRLFPKFGLEYRINRLLKKASVVKDHNGILFSKDIDDNLNSFLTEEELNNHEYVSWLKHDLAKLYLLYGITPDEYFLHSLQKEPEEYKSTILSRKRKDDLCCKWLGSDTLQYFNQLKDKWEFYKLAKPFFYAMYVG